MFGRAIVKGVALTANVVVVLIMLATLLASVVSPQKFILPAYATLIFPLFVIINIGFVVFWILAKKWLFLFSLVALLYVSPEISVIFPLHFGKTKVADNEKTIKVLSYNTKLNAMLVKHTASNPNPIIDYILNEDADIVCLQEFATSPNADFLTEKDVVKIFRDKYPYRYITYKAKSSWSEIGVATFSKFPIVNKDTVYFNSNYNLCQYLDVKIDDQVIRVVNVHLESNRLTKHDKDMPIELKDDFNAEKLSGTTMHLSRKLGSAYRIRAVQADSVAALISRTPYKLLLCGDFNDIPLSYSYTKIKGNMKDAFAESGFGLGWSYNESIFRFRIDHVMCSPEFNVIECKIGKPQGSDHYPVVSKINLNTTNF